MTRFEIKGKLRKEFIERVGTDLSGDFIVETETDAIRSIVEDLIDDLW